MPGFLLAHLGHIIPSLWEAGPASACGRVATVSRETTGTDTSVSFSFTGGVARGWGAGAAGAGETLLGSALGVGAGGGGATLAGSGLGAGLTFFAGCACGGFAGGSSKNAGAMMVVSALSSRSMAV